VIRAQFQSLASNLGDLAVKTCAKESFEGRLSPAGSGIFVDFQLIFEKDLIPTTFEQCRPYRAVLHLLLFGEAISF